MIELLAGSIQTSHTPNDPAQDSATSELKELREACQDFEAIFLQQLFRIMRESGPKSDLLNGGFAEDVFRDMLDEQLAQEISSSGDFGLSDLLYEQMREYVVAQAAQENEHIEAEN